MNRVPPHITICVCTYRRPARLKRLLDELKVLETGGKFTFSVVVADNDSSRSAEGVVAAHTANTACPVLYGNEPQQNIALARNAALALATGDYIAFLDDDELPSRKWLLLLLEACEKYAADGVLGPVCSRYEIEPPTWVRRSGLYNRPRHATGFTLSWRECRTGNALIQRSILAAMPAPFRSEFGTGGEDQDFFRRLMALGHRFVWCDEAVVYESVPPSRWRIPVLLRRALLRGRNTWRHEDQRAFGLSKSVVAIPLYALALPFSALAGRHVFVRYLIKTCDHLGKVMAAMRLNPVRKRDA